MPLFEKSGAKTLNNFLKPFFKVFGSKPFFKKVWQGVGRSPMKLRHFLLELFFCAFLVQKKSG
ncbi:MAG: hypothetical protein E7599_04880 [Ruminococcaceae bacterium]|nr:hypothetical protein [Oscillospiraceae bacterium]